jgi:hypothetical protein
MFRTVPLFHHQEVFSLYTEQWYMSYRFAVWHIPLLCLQWKTPDDGQRNCPKHVEFYCKNKFEKLVHLIGFIIRIYHDSRSPDRHIYLICWKLMTNVWKYMCNNFIVLYDFIWKWERPSVFFLVPSAVRDPSSSVLWYFRHLRRCEALSST